MVDFGRIVTAMVTPFDESHEVNWGQTKKLVRYLIDEQETDAIVVCGTTGESPTLSDEEKKRLFEVVVEEAQGKVKVIAGTGTNDTANSVELTRIAESAGVDGILAVAPYYNRPSQEGLFQHFSVLAQSTKLPIMLYNIPSRTGINVDLETTVRLARQFPNIVASKEAHGDLEFITAMAMQVPPGFKIYSGDDSLTLPFLSVGGYGVVSVAAHLIGRDIRLMIDAYAEGRPSEATQRHHKLFPIFRGMFNCPHRVPNPAPVKHALNYRGLNVGGLRLPMVPVTEREARFIENLLP